MKILVAVTGSIAAYKSPDIVRGLVNQGHEVKVVLSKGALEFINPQVFKFLGALETYLPEDDFNHPGVLHIQLAKWLDTFALVPASANTLAQLAGGYCPDLLTSIFLSLEPEKVKVIFPAMNTFMYQNPLTQKNLNALQTLPNVYLIDPDGGMLACGDEGPGKMPEVKGIIELIPLLANRTVNKKVVITAGATLSNLDPVRFVTNPAKGGSSYVIAKRYLQAGYQVHVIKGQHVIEDFKYLPKHPHYSCQTISTTQELLQAVQALQNQFDIYISPMAVSDIAFTYTDHKIKKKTLSGNFPFQFAPDVLKYVVEHKLPHQKIVGFAAETDLLDQTIQEKLSRKPVDLLVANLVNSGCNQQPKQGFGTTHGHYKLVTPQEVQEFTNLAKSELAQKIFELIN